MNNHRLQMNDTKTEVLYLSSKHLDTTFIRHPININDHLITPSRTVRNIGVTFDRHLDMNTHIGLMCRSAYLQLRRLSSVRRYMDRVTFEHLVHAFITSRLDYANALLCGLSQCQIARLQRVQNSAARILTGTPRKDHIKPVLRALHWLPIAGRIHYKLLLLTFKCFHDIAPSYLCDLVEFYSPDRDLRSSNLRLLHVPFTTSHRCKNSAFSYVAPTLWNQLPYDIRCANTLSAFKSKLKTFIFSQCYSEL